MAIVRTVIDELCESLIDKEGLTPSQLSEELGIDKEKILYLVDVLSSVDVVSLQEHPLGEPRVILHQVLHKPRVKQYVGKVLDEYSVTSFGITAKVEIIDVPDQTVNTYNLSYPLIGPYTERYLDIVRDQLAREIKITSEDIFDKRRSKHVLETFHNKAVPYLKNIPNLKDKDMRILIGTLLQKMYGLGVIEYMINDDSLEEIAINNSETPIAVYHKKYGWLMTNIQISSEEEIYAYSSQIGRKSGREITLLNPIMDAHLYTGERVTATLFPISTEGHTITIRKFARNPWTITEFINLNTLSLDMAALLWQAVQYEMNILIGGGTASGKTSMLNVISAFIPPTERIVSVEETREINLPKFLKWNWVPLTTREPNVEGKGGVSMLDLIQSSLRLRPDRIIVGEVRKETEAQVMFEAMHTGHSVYSTMHADTSEQIIRRLTHQPFNIPTTEMETLQLLIIQYRDRRTGRRRTFEISEIARSSEGISVNHLFAWSPRTDKFNKVGRRTRIFEELNLHTGMTPEEQEKDLKQKKTILNWMIKQGITHIDTVGSVVNAYYKSPETVLKGIKNKWSLSKILDMI